ncbi:peptidoglycan recognition protein [Streptomyces sp. Go40/10]|uniref:peptidoglycan recognition protein family protein n=1 Tax=Streptomyces sp. Go40/10 TaxID=2825844 RepID=UPI001E4DA6DA|nr:peptidoglycan recognition protein [Streptomyces sp. Go40/10]UFR04122.1 peptidoglycan recognition protein [Streptomyces sp. Go40/10]
MRGFLTSCPGVSPLAACSIGVALATAVALAPAGPAVAGTPAGPAVAGMPAGSVVAGASAGSAVPGSTRSLPLAPVSREGAPGAVPEQGLHRTGLARFALVGVVWDDPATELHGRVQVRTRSVATGEWSGWQDVETHNADHGAETATAERSSGRVHGGTAPLWVGDSDGVDVRVRADGAGESRGMRSARGASAGGPRSALRSALPSGLRLELVDPGEGTGETGGTEQTSEVKGVRDAGETVRDAGEAVPGNLPADDPPRTALDTEAALAASAANADITDFGSYAIPELDRQATERELARLQVPGLQDPARAKPYIGPRPRIVTRRGWGADESLREHGFVYTKAIKAAFVHHTATGNTYTCAQAPSVIRSIYRYHVKSMGWRDIGYNFLVDKCGTLYEGRAGGVAKAVLGAHTLGFNTNSMGIAVIGTYTTTKPAGSAVTAVARLTAWKLGLYGVNPRGKTYLTSGGGNLYPKGKSVRLNVISGHRDGFATECPGKRLYAKLGTARSSAAAYQGR